jgi:hypothetical protein
MTAQAFLAILTVVMYAYLVFHEEVHAAVRGVVSTENETIQQLEWRQHHISHAAYYGAVVAGVFGFQSHPTLRALVTAAWFITGLWWSRRLANLIHEKEEAEAAAVEAREVRIESLLQAMATHLVTAGKPQLPRAKNAPCKGNKS